MSGSPAASTDAIPTYQGWQNEVVCRLQGMVSRKEPVLICIVNVGGTDIIMIDRRIPAGIVRFT
jgi:hypothetical protein